MQEFTPGSALLGGVLIALGLGGMLLGQGRIVGISGIVAGVVRAERNDWAWRALFLAGIVAGGVIAHVVEPGIFGRGAGRPWPLVVASGVLVAFGTRLSNGCTSGHGVIGNSRLSPRSIVATITFIAFGAVTAIVAGRALGVS